MWTVLVDAAILIKYAYSFKWRIFTHVFLMVLVLVGTVVLISLIIADKQPNIGLLPKSYGAHYIIGLIILGVVILQCLAGAIQRIALRYPKFNPSVITIFRKIHLYSGYGLIIAGKVNVIIGWAMKGKFVGLAICSIFTMVSLGVLILYIYSSSETINQAVLVPRT